jgi:hypothetical protein
MVFHEILHPDLEVLVASEFRVSIDKVLPPSELSRCPAKQSNPITRVSKSSKEQHDKEWDPEPHLSAPLA